MNIKTDILAVHHSMNNLYDVAERIKNRLDLLNAKYDFGNYNNHYIRINDNFEKQSYYVPVFSLSKHCDIGINIDGIFCEVGVDKSKLSVEKIGHILRMGKSLEIYGFDDCLQDFHSGNDSAQAIYCKIMDSPEKIIQFNKSFPYGDINEAIDFAVKMTGF